jgi:imidazolonepropionase-like amidohydrolase
MVSVIGALILFGLITEAPAARSQRASSVGALALTRVTVIDATGAPARPKMTVVIAGGRIAAIGENGKTPIPKGARVIDASGKYLIPGLWDMHVHLAKAGENALPLFIANGVTGVRDMGGDAAMVLKWRDEIGAGKRLGPRIKAAGPILESARNVERMKREGTVEPVDRFRIGVAGPDEAENVVERVVKMGVDFIKIRTVASPETYRAIAAAARKRNLALVGACGCCARGGNQSRTAKRRTLILPTAQRSDRRSARGTVSQDGGGGRRCHAYAGRR